MASSVLESGLISFVFIVLFLSIISSLFAPLQNLISYLSS